MFYSDANLNQNHSDVLSYALIILVSVYLFLLFLSLIWKSAALNRLQSIFSLFYLLLAFSDEPFTFLYLMLSFAAMALLNWILKINIWFSVINTSSARKNATFKLACDQQSNSLSRCTWAYCRTFAEAIVWAFPFLTAARNSSRKMYCMNCQRKRVSVKLYRLLICRGFGYVCIPVVY